MEINYLLLKQMAIFSAIAGGILGVLTLIPIINTLAFAVLLIFLSAIILVYMKKKNQIGIIDIREGSIFGAIIGFISFITFSIVCIPLGSILGLIFKGYYLAFLPYFLNSFGGFIILIMLVVFLALLSALMNGFTGLATAYVYEILSGIKKEENEQVDFEIK